MTGNGVRLEKSFVGGDVAVQGEGMNSVEAFSLALMGEMERDAAVVYCGQDVERNGGVFRYTDGIFERFGARIFNTPLDEFTMGGVPVGMAMGGLKPIVEIQFMGFSLPAISALYDHGARTRARTRGRLTCPMVLTMPLGGEIGAPEFHGEAMEGFYMNIPGIRIVVPSSPSRTYGLLLASIRDPDPVVFLNPAKTRLDKEAVVDDGVALPLDTAVLVREGTDVSLIAWGAMLKKACQAADALEDQGISCEVLDVATLKPLDEATIVASVEKTGRAVIIQEGPKTGGVGAEIAAVIAEKAKLETPGTIVRVAGYDAPVIAFSQERFYYQFVPRIVDAAQALMQY